MRETRDSLDRLMQTVVEMAEQTFETEADGEDYVVAGQTHLMQCADLSDLDKLRQHSMPLTTSRIYCTCSINVCMLMAYRFSLARSPVLMRSKAVAW